MNSCLKAAKISEMDWFRLAQDRSTWRKIVTTAFPVEKVNPEREGQLDSWRPGRPVPPFALPQGRPERPDNEDEGSEADVAERVRGRARGQGQAMYGVGGRRAAARATRQQRAHRDEQGNWACPVCAETFNKANQVEFHYQEHHAVTDPRLVTTEVFTCQHCQATYRRRKQLTDHLCPARQKLERLDQIDPMIHVGGPSREEAVPDGSPWALFTDGSGGTRGVAGWGVGIYTCRAPTTQEDWVAALYGPVITLRCDPQWMGAEAHTNNTGELSAIGEACKWLLQWKARKPEAPHPSAVILYDSQYAYGVATRLFRAKENQLLATSVASLVDAVRASMSLEFEHVKGHSGAHGNEVADRLADRGSQGRVSPHCMHLVVYHQRDRWEGPRRLRAERLKTVRRPSAGPWSGPRQTPQRFVTRTARTSVKNVSRISGPRTSINIGPFVEDLEMQIRHACFAKKC